METITLHGEKGKGAGMRVYKKESEGSHVCSLAKTGTKEGCWHKSPFPMSRYEGTSDLLKN